MIGGIDLTVEDGGFYVLVNPLECGNPTLLCITSELAEQTSGRLETGGCNIGDLDPVERNIAALRGQMRIELP